MLDSRAVRALLSLGMVVGLGATGTYAYWTDVKTVSGTTITAGTIKLQVTDNYSNATAFTKMNVSTMVPGESTAGVLKVQNIGTAPLRYHVNATPSNNDGKGLGAALDVRVTGDAVVSTSGRNVTCPGSRLANTGLKFTTDLVATSTAGRQLTANQTEYLCIQATLPLGADTALQGATTDVVFTLTGTSY